MRRERWFFPGGVSILAREGQVSIAEVDEPCTVVITAAGASVRSADKEGGSEELIMFVFATPGMILKPKG